MGEKMLDDLGVLGDAVRSAVSEALESGERVLATMPGSRGTAMVVTDRRAAIWKDRVLRSWSLDELSGVGLETGFLAYIAVRGRGIPDKKLGFGDLGDVPHAIQISDKNRGRDVAAALERLIARPPATLREGAGGGTPSGVNLEGAIMEARGSGGRITLFDDRIRIKHEGLLGLTKGIYKGDKEIPIDQITAIQWRDDSKLAAGHIQFTIMGGASDSKAGSTDENSMMFVGSQQPEFERLKAEVEKRMAAYRQARFGAPAGASVQPDIPGQIKKLAELRDAGILTEDEFAAKKAQLLSRL